MRYKLKLKQLDFVSLVDDPAQPNAKCLLIKRRGNADEVSATARLVKASDELGLAFFWAFTTTEKDGSNHYDLHGDQVLSDNDMIKAAAEFMEKGGAVDEMHDSEQTGRVVFAMPMTPEIAKAYGVETKTSGLMVALRPSADAMAKLKDGTYTAVSIAGMGERVEARKSARVVKSSLYTDEVDGHQHKICVYDDGSMYVEHATMGGAEYSHSHGIVFEGGTLTILADSGHSHTLAEGLAGVVAVPADAIVVVEARLGDQRFSVEDLRIASKQAQALASKSTRTAAAQHGDTMTTKVIALTEAQHAHFSKLATADAEAFIAKSSAERDAVLADIAKADEVVFKGELTGIEVRKSQGDFALKLAQSAEASEKRAREASATAEVEKSKREETELRKRAEPIFKGLAGSDEVHAVILGAVEATKNADALTALKAMTDGARKMMSDAGTAKGANLGEDPVEKTANSEYEELVTKTMTDDKCDRPAAADKVLKTKRGQDLYAAMSKRK